MRIAYITHSHANLGGMDKMIAYKATYFAERGYDVYILTCGSEIEPYFYFDPRIKIVYIKSPQKRKMGQYLTEVSERLNEIKPDISISLGERNPQHIYKIKDDSKKILEVHFSKYRRRAWMSIFDKFIFGHHLANPLLKVKDKIVKGYDKFIVLTEEDKQSWKYLDNVITIPNPLLHLPEDTSSCENKRVIAVGRLVTQKGFDYLLKAWKIVSQKYPDWILDIYGEGKKKAFLEKIISQLDLKNSVNLCGATKHMDEKYQKSSIMAFTSRYEGQGLVLLEAMSHGIPVVSFTCKCGPKDIIQDQEDGFLVPFRNVNLFAEKLSLLMGNEELRKKMGAKARQNIQRYDADKIMQQWTDLFDELRKERQ